MSGFAGLIALMGIGGYLLASSKPAVSVSVGERTPFHRVFSRVWLYGMALGFGTIGFGVIATFITLYFASRDWSGAALALSVFSLGFVMVRLGFGRYITRFGGLKVSLGSFLLECLGLITIWQADSAMVVGFGAFLTGCGFSLIFPALGVEAVKQVQRQDQGAALGTYSAFLDLGLGLTGPVAGLFISHWGMQSVYLAAAMMVLGAMLMTLRLHLQRSRQSQ
jgi:predicted MFS family arabinose efflux permease